MCPCRRAVRQRRNPKESADLTSVQELLAAIDRQCHSGEKHSHCTFFTNAVTVEPLQAAITIEVT